MPLWISHFETYMWACRAATVVRTECLLIENAQKADL